MAKLTVSCLILVAAVHSAGCGGNERPPTGRLTGKVTHAGKPLPGGSISLHPKGGGQPIPILIGPDGQFTSMELPLGEMQVSIETESVKESQGAMSYAGGENPTVDPKMAELTKDLTPPSYVPISQKYNNPTTSGFIVTIAEGTQSKDFELMD